MSAGRTRLTADVELEDKLAWGLTARQLVILAVTALLSYALFTAAGSVVPRPLAVAVTVPLALAGVLLALGRRDGLSGDRLALAAIRHLAQPARRVTTVQGLPARLQHAPVQPAVGLLRAPIRSILKSGVIELGDGSHGLLLRATGTSWQLRSEEEQHALAEAYGRWLNSLAEPAAIVVRSEGVELTGHASEIERASTGLAHPALRDCALAYARFLDGLAGEGLRRRQIVLVLGTRTRGREAAQAALQRRASDAAGLLRQAGVELHPLSGEQAAALLFGALEPPGPPAGSHLEGVVHQC
jgi:hypothetical protein